MPHRSKRTSRSIAVKATELAIAAPQVVAHRMARMVMAGPMPSKRDRKEFTAMVAEKNTAFVESWQAMATQAVTAQQALASSFLRLLWSPTKWPMPGMGNLVAQAHDDALGILGKGMAPVHRKAVANARRLARTRLR